MGGPTDVLRGKLEPGLAGLSIVRQCELLGLPRSSYYFKPAGATVKNLQLMRLIDEQYTEMPYYGSRRMTAWLKKLGHDVNRKRIINLMHLMLA